MRHPKITKIHAHENKRTASTYTALPVPLLRQVWSIGHDSDTPTAEGSADFVYFWGRRHEALAFLYFTRFAWAIASIFILMFPKPN